MLRGFWHSRQPVARFAAALGCGCSSGVEHNLAKVGVEGSNPFARSRDFQTTDRPVRRPIMHSRLVSLAVLALAGACLRLTVLAIPPVVPQLHAELHLSETGIGWLSSVPPM